MATPYYATSPEDHQVYHNKLNCPDGKRILEKNKVVGSTGGRPLCKECPKVSY